MSDWRLRHCVVCGLAVLAAMHSLPGCAAEDPKSSTEVAGTVPPPAERPSLEGLNAGLLLSAQLPPDTPGHLISGNKPIAPKTFSQALELAYWTSPALLAGRSRMRSVDYRLPQAVAASGPKLSFEASYGYLRNNTQLTSDLWLPRSGWTMTAAAILTQPLITFGRNASGQKQALAEIDFERSALRSSEASTLFGAMGAYVGLLRDRAGLKIFEDDLALLEREFSDNTARFAKREVTSSDVQQVETRLEQARAQVLTAQRTLANSQASFLARVGALPGDELAPPNPLVLPVRTLEEAFAFAETNSPVLQAAYAREQVSRAAVAAAKAELMPRIDFRGSARIGSTSPYDDRFKQTELSGAFVLSGPIFESGRRMSAVREAEAANDADWRLIDQALRDNREQVAQAWNEWLSQSASLEHLQRAAQAAQQALDGALLQEKAGFRTTLDVLNLARELLVANANYNSAQADAYIARARILAVLGTLEFSYLFPDAKVHDPQEHLDLIRRKNRLSLVQSLALELDKSLLPEQKPRPVRDPAASQTPQGADIAPSAP